MLTAISAASKAEPEAQVPLTAAVLAAQFADAAEVCLAAMSDNRISNDKFIAAGWTDIRTAKIDDREQRYFFRRDRKFPIHLSPDNSFPIGRLDFHCWMSVDIEKQSDYALFDIALAKKIGRPADKIEQQQITEKGPDTISEYTWSFPAADVELWVSPLIPGSAISPEKPTVFITVTPKKVSGE